MVTDQHVDNFENNSDVKTSIRELSDLYPCRLPIRIKTPGCIKKSTKIVFASLEHAFMYRMVRFPVISPSSTPVDGNTLQITAEDAMLFMRQFEPDGVFASWESISKYCDVAKITTGLKGMHNIGLIARHLCSKKHCGNVIRRQVVSRALELWLHEGNTVARSISTCLKLGRPNYSSYKAQIRRLFAKKLENNIYISNILYYNKNNRISVSCRNCKSFTKTRLELDPFYNLLIEYAQETATWKVEQSTLVAICMSLHPRLGKFSIMRFLEVELVRLVVDFAIQV
jgi:hypothetical protein